MHVTNISRACRYTGLVVVSSVAALAAPANSQSCDPVEIAHVAPSDGAVNDFFGSNVAVDGDTAVIGSFQDDNDAGVNAGAAYVFVRSSTSPSEWIEQARLTASDGAAGDFFGVSIAISGDTALVGAYSADALGLDSGAAYVFIRSGPPGKEVWTQQAKLTASDGAADDRFGFSAAIEGDTAVIGALFDDSPLNSAGSVYVFMRSGPPGPPGEEVWTQHAKLTASDAADGDEFGKAVAICGDTIIIGATGDDAPAGNSGSAYVFTRSGLPGPPGKEVWTEQTKLTASDGAANDLFGFAVSCDGNTAIVTAVLDDAPALNAGSAYVFVRTGPPGPPNEETWAEQAHLIASDGALDDRFGFSAWIEGDRVIVGAYQDDDAGNASGSAYLFTRAGAAWTQKTKLLASDASANEQFGVSVALDAETIVIGANHGNGGGTPGSAYVLDLNCAGPLEGACCVDGHCAMMRQTPCETLSGEFLGVGSSCDAADCEPACAADIEPAPGGNGVVDIDDLFKMIAEWGACP